MDYKEKNSSTRHFIAILWQFTTNADFLRTGYITAICHKMIILSFLNYKVSHVTGDHEGCAVHNLNSHMQCHCLQDVRRCENIGLPIFLARSLR